MTKGTEHTESDICCLARVNADTKLSLVISGCCKRTSFVLVWIRILKYLFRICSQFKVWFDVKNSSSKNTVDSGHRSYQLKVSQSRTANYKNCNISIGVANRGESIKEMGTVCECAADLYL